MKYLFCFLLMFVSISACSQNRICFMDSLQVCKDDIAKLEAYNNKLIKKHPKLKYYSDIRQFHFFVLYNTTERKINDEEYSDYSFLKKLCFLRHRYSVSWYSKKTYICVETYLFTQGGEALGHISDGQFLPLDWLHSQNVNDLGELVANDRISFAFCGSTLKIDNPFYGGWGDYYCVIDDKIYILDNFELMLNPDDRVLRLTPIEYLFSPNSTNSEEHSVSYRQLLRTQP